MRNKLTSAVYDMCNVCARVLFAAFFAFQIALGLCSLQSCQQRLSLHREASLRSVLAYDAIEVSYSWGSPFRKMALTYS